MVQENNETFLEIYYTANTSNDIYVDILNQNITGKVVTILYFEAPTDTATVLDELTIQKPKPNAKIVYSNQATKGEYTFSNDGLYLVLCHVNGNNLCNFDVVAVVNNELHRTNIKTSSQYLTVTYTDKKVTINSSYTTIILYFPCNFDFLVNARRILSFLQLNSFAISGE